MSEEYQLSASYTMGAIHHQFAGSGYMDSSVVMKYPALEERGSVSHQFDGPIMLLDAEDQAMLDDETLMAHVRAAEQAHARANAGEDVDWPAVIRDDIVQ